MKFIIDCGHGGTDPGAIGPTGLKEADVTLAIGKVLESISKMVGHTPVMTRSHDEYVSLEERAKFANAQGGKCFVSIHCNSFTSQNPEGFEIWTYRGQNTSDTLASSITHEWSKAFPDHLIRADWSDGDVDKESGFYVLKHTAMPAVLLETAFISNPKWETWLREKGNLKKIAEVILDGLEAWGGKQMTPEKQEELLINVDKNVNLLLERHSVRDKLCEARLFLIEDLTDRVEVVEDLSNLKGHIGRQSSAF